MSGARNVAARRQIGLDFIEYLEESNKRSIKDKTQLRDIYNSEFRTRDGGLRDPNFSSVLYALKTSHKAKIYNGQVHFNPKVRVFPQDQWRRLPSRPQQQQQQQGLPNGLPAQKGVCPAPSPGRGQDRPSPDGGAVSGVRDRRTLAHLLLQNLEANKDKYISSKMGVTVTTEHDTVGGRIQFSVDRVREVYDVRLCVKNGGAASVQFTFYCALHWMSCFKWTDPHRVTRVKPLQLPPGASYEIELQFFPSVVGFYPATLAFEFKSDSSAAAFHIVRFAEFQAATSLAKELAPTAPYRPRPIAAVTIQPYTMKNGDPPKSATKMHLESVVALRDYKVPPYVKGLVNVLKSESPSLPSKPIEEIESAKRVLEGALSRESYSQKFQLLLYLEELQMDVDIRKYKMENKPMFSDRSSRNLLVLEVPGVSENRPSVLRGDTLIVTKVADTASSEGQLVKYRGYVHRVELEQVKLSFHKKLLDSFFDGMKFNVEFTVNRLTTRIQQRAAELASKYKLGEVLFPSGVNSPQKPQLPTLSLFDRKLKENAEQYQAVQNIVAGSSRPAPYLVFGPPGTGKTVTVVEAIKQLEKMQSSAHILACAPSNSAADLLCKKIVEHVDKRKVFRMYASSWNPRVVPDELLDCCNLDDDEECFVFPSVNKLMEYKIMVTTLLTAARLVTGGVPQGYYTHVFVDEAGHAVETECIIPLAGLLQPESGQVVLAGDPKQLGPILRSPFAIKYGMGLSLLERLMRDVPLYQKDDWGTLNNRYVTKLLRNYRSHPAILEMPNKLFYDGELQIYADEIVRNSFCNWEYLPKKGFPVIFHGVTGRDEREANSPSFFNIAEVEVLVDYLKKLLQNQGKKGMGTIAPKDIGIIAPYRKQVEKIRIALRLVEKELRVMNIKDLKVGSVEEFQGQERKVILVSTVRSTLKYVRIDQQFTLGFIKNEKRFNVAMTRAKALLIVVGNPLVLRGDATWGSFITYCEGSGYTGYDFSNAESEDDMVKRLAALYIQAEPPVQTEESVVQQQLDPEWREERI